MVEVKTKMKCEQKKSEKSAVFRKRDDGFFEVDIGTLTFIVGELHRFDPDEPEELGLWFTFGHVLNYHLVQSLFKTKSHEAELKASARFLGEEFLRGHCRWSNEDSRFCFIQ